MRSIHTLRLLVLPSLGCAAACLLGLPLYAGIDGAACDPSWISTFGGYPGIRYGEPEALIGFDDGSGPALYVGGSWGPYAGSVLARAIARWDGTSWSSVGIGTGFSPSSSVDALAVFDDGGGPALYAAGTFTSIAGVAANGIARWDGTSWTALGSGVSGVATLAVYDDGGGAALYAAGSFSSAGGVPAAEIARWDGTSWTALGSGLTHASIAFVRALTVYDDGSGPALYAGGQFDTAGGVPAANLARWDGSSWSEVGGGTNGRVNALCAFDGGGGSELVVGGEFTGAGPIAPSRIAKWNGTSWSNLFGGVSDTVWSLTVHDDGNGPDLYVAGQFASAGGGVASSGVVRWNGTSWSSVDGGTDLLTATVASVDLGSGPVLFAGGHFEHAGGVQAAHIAEWDGSSWSSLGDGLDGSVSALTVYDDGSGPALVAGGAFSVAGREPLARLGRWDGSGWSPFGAGLDDDVTALCVYDAGGGMALYAGGGFLTAGGLPASRIARWDGTSWSALGGGLSSGSGGVNALAVHDDGGGVALFAGGDFSVAGGAPANRIARWDGASWSALGSGTDLGVTALVSYDDGLGPTLFVGGMFTTAGGLPASRIARWDGSSWSAVGGGLGGLVFNSEVRAFAAYDDGTGTALYVAGEFESAGGAPASSIARWDGTSWFAVGGGVTRSSPGRAVIDSLAVYDDGVDGPALYAAGAFTGAGGAPAKRIARWDGTSWSTLGNGAEDPGQIVGVHALVVFDEGAGPALYAGGSFNVVGDPASSCLAKWGGCSSSASTTFCFGDAADCPCGNAGAPGRGCDNAQGTGGVELALVTQATSPNGATVTGSGFSTMGAPTALVFRSAGLAATPAPFGDGLGCLSPAGVVRLAATTAVAGTSTHAFGHSAMAGNGDFYYQIWYRNQPAGFCTPAAFNLSNGLRITWP